MKKIVCLLFLILIAMQNSAQSQREIYQIPLWAKEAIWYQIFPERFCNGDESNDPKPLDMIGAWPYFTPVGWKIHPWTSDWYKLQPWEVNLNKNFYDIVNIRRYGGDLQGIIDKLDYLKELGINSIYLNPIFEAPSLHKYDAAMYHHIDNNFGPDPEGDRIIWDREDPSNPTTWQWTSADRLFLQLIDEVHKRGMKIIIDGVFNHTGTQFWAFKDIVKNQNNSKFKDWYIINKWDDPSTEENEFEYAGWYGVKDLPEIKEDENGLVEGPKDHIKAIVKRWMDPNNDGDPSDGIDGWRLDVAEMVNHKFWIEFRNWVREINPNAYLVGEVWWEDWEAYKMFDASPWLKGDQFDAVMNYRFTRAVKDFALADNVKIDAAAFADTLKNIMNSYQENFYVMMNLLGSHDTERLGSLAVNPDGRYDHGGNVRDNRNFEIRKPNSQEKKRIMLATAIQVTLPGSPAIYYGDEVGMWGGDDPDCRKPMIWNNFEYESETVHPFDQYRPIDDVKIDQELFSWYKKIISIRKENKELSLGNINFELVSGKENLLIYNRVLEDNSITIIANGSEIQEEIYIKEIKLLPNKTSFIDLLTQNKIESEKSLLLYPYQIIVIK
jgi:glycosidase